MPGMLHPSTEKRLKYEFGLSIIPEKKARKDVKISDKRI